MEIDISKYDILPNLWIMIATIGSLFVLLIILTYFFYNPIKKMVQRRKDFINKNINDSIEAKNNAFSLENESRIKLEEAKNIGNDILLKAKLEAEEIKNQYIEEGKAKYSQLISEAKTEIDSRKVELEKQTYNEIVSVAMEISKKIIKDNISKNEVEKYLDEYLENKNA